MGAGYWCESLNLEPGSACDSTTSGDICYLTVMRRGNVEGVWGWKHRHLFRQRTSYRSDWFQHDHVKAGVRSVRIDSMRWVHTIKCHSCGYRVTRTLGGNKRADELARLGACIGISMKTRKRRDWTEGLKTSGEIRITKTKNWFSLLLLICDLSIWL